MIGQSPEDHGSRRRSDGSLATGSAVRFVIPRPILAPAVFGLLIVCAWYLAAAYGGISPFVLPSPVRVIQVVWSSASALLDQARTTVFEAVIGLILAVVLGLILSVLMSLSAKAREALYPNLVVLQLIPKIALAPLFIVWLGIGSESRLAFALLLSFFPILLASITGLTHTDAAAMRLCRSLLASERQIFFMVRLPYALPHIFGGIKIGATMTMIGVVVGEFITGQKGLGYIVMFAAFNMDSPLMFAAILWLCGIGVAIYGAVVIVERLVQRRFGQPVA